MMQRVRGMNLKPMRSSLVVDVVKKGYGKSTLLTLENERSIMMYITWNKIHNLSLFSLCVML